MNKITAISNIKRRYSQRGENGWSIPVNLISFMARKVNVIILLQLRPFKAKKYRLEKHPNYKYTDETDKKNLRNPPYLLSYNDEEMESVRVKAPQEEGYILPAVVDSARKRALEVEKKKKAKVQAKAQREMERLVPVEADLSKSKAQYEKDLADQQNKLKIESGEALGKCKLSDLKILDSFDPLYEFKE